MADTETQERESTEEQNGGGNGSNGGHGAGRTAVRAAAIAAVSGATALAAKKAFGGGGSSDDDDDKPERSQKGGGGNNEIFGSMMTSAWDSARDSLVPMLENAASSAGEYLAKNGPDVVRETIVPRFIDGFQSANDSDDDD